MGIHLLYGSDDMNVLITYDVNTTDSFGRKRLRKIAKECVNRGQRVQNSVFECSLNTSEYKMLKNRLCEIMDEERDSLRFYMMGKNLSDKVECFGVKTTYNAEGILQV